MLRTSEHQRKGLAPSRRSVLARPRAQGRGLAQLHLGTRRLTEPFFHDTIEASLRHPFALLFRQQTPIETLGEWHAVRPGLPPAGFIFHMSRCGSTLLAQLLAALPQNVVLSEAAPLDAVVRAHLREPGLDAERQVAWLRWLVSALGQPRQGGEKRLFIKLDCWHVLSLPLIQRAFPTVPWVFLYRDPVEVLVSQLRQRGSHTVPGLLAPSPFQVDAPATRLLPPEEYCSRVLAELCEAALRHRRCGTGRFVNYRRLPEAVRPSLLDFFGVEATPADRERLGQVALRDAKNPCLPFVEDAAAKSQQATDAVRRAAEQWLGPLYQEMEALQQR